MPDDTPSEQPPAPDHLDQVFTPPSTEERIYALLVQSDEALSAPTVAERLDCSTDTARKYLDWFTELGIARTRAGRPTTYTRNEEYFEWQYVTQLADAHSLEELKENVLEMRDLLQTFRERYDAEDPGSVDLDEAAKTHEATVEDAWDDLSTWAGLVDELRLHERARQRLTDRAEASTA